MSFVSSRSNDGVGLVPYSEFRKKKLVHTPVICVLFALLVIVGLINLYSASLGGGFFHSQVRHSVVGLVAFVVCGWLIQPRHLNTHAYWIFGVTVALLVAVLIMGKVGGGSQRWIYLGPVGFQPSEFAKIVVAIIIARFFYSNRLNQAYRLRDLWQVGATAGAIFALIFPQPDFGTAGLCLLIAICQLMFVRIDLRSLGLVSAAGLAVGLIGWTFLLMDYQKKRVLNFLNPELDPSGSGYNALQSLVAVGSGGLQGKGYLQGTQTQLQFLPTRHTDFVFSVFAEEHGFWGGVILFMLFAILAYVALEIARSSKDTFSSLLAVGLAAFILLEFTINVAMVLGIFPVVGLPLPFFSYGGSSLLTMCISVGLLVAIDRDNNGLGRKSHSLARRQMKS